jgi:hypothetical protein
VAISDEDRAHHISRTKLEGAKSMLVIALSPGDLAALGMKDGDIRG